MKPKTIFIIWIVSVLIGYAGVALFVTAGEDYKTISRVLMSIGILLSSAWFIGLIGLIRKKVFRKA